MRARYAVSHLIILSVCNMEYHQLTINNITPIASDAISVAIDVPINLPANLQADYACLAGQYLSVKLTEDAKEQRTYTICSAPNESPNEFPNESANKYQLRLAIRQINGGAISNAIAKLNKGDVIYASLPMGRFAHHINVDAQNHYLLMASGVGITPIFAIMQAILSGEPNSNITLIFGNQNSERMMLGEDVSALKDKFMERLNLVYVMSRQPQDVAWRNGRLDGTMLENLMRLGVVSNTPNDVFDMVYICLPGTARDEAITTLQNAGMDKKRIKSERFVSTNILEEAKHVATDTTPTTDNISSQVTVNLDGTEHHLTIRDPQQNILQAAQNQNLNVPFSCQAGMCATCRCKLLAGDVSMQQNYSLENWELEAGYILACQSLPRSKQVTVDFDAV